MQAARDQLQQEIRERAFDGPREGERRTVWTWRPARAPQSPLLVVYVFDGMDGLQVLLLRLKPAFDSGALPPVLFVAPDAYPSTEAPRQVIEALQRDRATLRWCIGRCAIYFSAGPVFFGVT
jgi:hypothetical protein